MTQLTELIRSIDATIDDVDKAERAIVARINCASLDRFNSVIDPGGGLIDSYRRNPVVLWEHGKDPRRFTDPIGRNLWLNAYPKKGPVELRAKTKFLDDDFSQQRYEWYRDGVLNAFSVRALPREYGPATREEIAARPELGNRRPNETRGAFEGPLMIRSWELAEYSGTAVPGNANCLEVARALKVLDLVDRELLWLPDGVRPLFEEKARGAPIERKIVEEDGKYFVLSEDGSKRLGGPYGSRGEAEKRLEQVEYFKHQDAEKRSAPYIDADGLTVRDADGRMVGAYANQDDARELLRALSAPAGPIGAFERTLMRLMAEQRARFSAAAERLVADLDLDIYGRV